MKTLTLVQSEEFIKVISSGSSHWGIHRSKEVDVLDCDIITSVECRLISSGESLRKVAFCERVINRMLDTNRKLMKFSSGVYITTDTVYIGWKSRVSHAPTWINIRVNKNFNTDKYSRKRYEPPYLLQQYVKYYHCCSSRRMAVT